MAAKKKTSRRRPNKPSPEEKSQRRGHAAQTLTDNVAFKEALKWISDATLIRFKASKSPQDAWAARLDFQAAEDFATILIAYIKDGLAAAQRAEKKRGKLQTYELGSDKAYEKYLTDARKARADFDKVMKELKLKAPTTEVSDGHA